MRFFSSMPTSKLMKTTTDPFEMADAAWRDTHEVNFERMAERITVVISQMDPPIAGGEEFLARVMELAWKTGFACGLDFMSRGFIQSVEIGKN